MPRVAVIVNPVAGRRSKEVSNTVRETLDSLQVVEWKETDRRGQAKYLAEQAVAKQLDALVVVGGDGTVNEVVNGIAGSSLPLLIVPSGTVNVFAREMGLPTSPESAIQLIAEGNPTRLSLGQINERYFLLMAGIGLDGEVVAKTSDGLKKQWGKWSYVMMGLRTLAGYKGYQLEVEIDHHQHFRGGALVIGNSRLYAGPFSVTPEANNRDALLDYCIFKGRGAWKMVQYAWEIMRGAHVENPDVLLGRCKHMKVRARPEAYIQVDGEFLGRTPSEISIVPSAISVFLPKKS